MEKMFLIFTIFILLICISSFSWATNDTLIVDTDVLNFGLGELDCTEDIDNNFLVDTDTLTNCLAWTYDNRLYVQFSSGYFFVYNDKIVSYNDSYGLCYDSNGDIYGTLGNFNYDLYEDYIELIYLNSYYNNLTCNALYSDENFNSIYEDNITDYNNTSFFENAFNFQENSGESGGENGGENGGESGGENDGGILNFLTNFWSNLGTNLLHIVVPNSEDWSELQDSFEDNILDKFNITSMSFNDDLEYDWRSNNIFRK